MTASTAFEQISSTSLNSSSCTHLVIAPKHWIKLPKDRTLQQHYTYLVAIFIYEYICDTFHSSHSQIHFKCSKIQFYVMLVIYHASYLFDRMFMWLFVAKEYVTDFLISSNTINGGKISSSAIEESCCSCSLEARRQWYLAMESDKLANAQVQLVTTAWWAVLEFSNSSIISAPSVKKAMSLCRVGNDTFQDSKEIGN